MARVYVVSDAGIDRYARHCWARMVEDVDGDWTAETRCGETLTDRWDFADTVRAAEVHVDQCKRPSA